MPFSRRQVYAGDGKYRRVRKGEAVRAPLPSTNEERERAVGQTFEDAVKATLATPHLQYKHLVRLLEDPRYGPVEIVDKFPWDVFESHFRQSERFLMEQLRDGATQEVAAVHGYFNAKDPHVLLWGARHAAEMVTHISEDQRRLLRNHVMNAHLSGIAPKQLAREIRNLIGLTPAWQTAVTNYHRGLLDKGVDEKFAAKQSARYHDRLVKARAKMIARTEVMRAENEGKLLGWQQAIDFGFLTPNGKVRWKTAITNVCPICLPMDNAEIDFGPGNEFQVSDPRGKVWGVRTPPAHPHCRCTILYVPPSAEQMAQEVGLDLGQLIAEITPGTYQPDPEPEEDPDLEPEDSHSGVSAIPDPPTFTTRAEAQKWAETYLAPTSRTETHWRMVNGKMVDSAVPVTRTINFEDLNVEAINPLVQELVNFSREYPETFDHLHALGTLQAIYRDLPGYPRRVPGSTYAQTTRDNNTGATTLGLNKTWFSGKNVKRYRDSFITDVSTGWHPATSADEIATTVIHEIGHLIHYSIAAADSGWSSSLIEALVTHTGHPASFWDLSRPDTQDYVASQLSRYALNNWFEFVAEAWAGYKTHPSPTPIMQAVGEWMVQRGK